MMICFPLSSQINECLKRIKEDINNFSIYLEHYLHYWLLLPFVWIHPRFQGQGKSLLNLIIIFLFHTQPLL